MITYSKALLLTALGVMFCSGCMTEQQRQLIELGATLSNNEQGEVSMVFLNNTQITDAGLAKFKEALPGHESRAGETGGFGGGQFGGGGITIFRD